VEWLRDDVFLATDDQTRIDVEKTHRWLTGQYWALGRTMDVVAKAIENSVALTCLSPQGEQAGVARWVTDRAAIARLCDVVGDTETAGRASASSSSGPPSVTPRSSGSSCDSRSPTTPTASTSSSGPRSWRIPASGWSCATLSEGEPPLATPQLLAEPREAQGRQSTSALNPATWNTEAR